MRLNWGTGIALVYGLFAACTVGFVVFAMQHPADLVSEDYYATSLRHDARREAVENAAALGATLARAEAGVLVVALPAWHAGDASGRVRFYRPSDSSADNEVALAPDAQGRQHLPLADLGHGRWIVQIEWVSGGRAYYHELPVMVR